VSDKEFSIPGVVREAAPKLAIVLGSGLSSFADGFPSLAEIPYGDIAGLPVSRVPGHHGAFTLADAGGTPILLARGRVHLYEGISARDAAAGVRFMAEAGIERLILTNAAGALNPSFSVGEWMMITDHLNLTWTSPLLGGSNFHDMTGAYSPRLRALFRGAADRLGIPLHEGVYAANLGPQYETPAEVRALQVLGADAAGMSTVPETIQARALGLEVAAFSCLTNWGAGISGEPLSHEEVTEVGRSAAGQLVRLLNATIGELT